MICPRCNAENPEGSDFCNKCGAELKAEIPNVEPQQPTEVPKAIVNENKEKTKIGLGYVLSWIVGGLFLISGLMINFTIAPGAGIPLVIAALVLLPPVTKAVEDKFNFSLSRGLRVTIVIILFLIYAANLPSDVLNDNSGTFDTTPSSEEISQPEYYSIGDRVVVGDLAYTVTKVRSTLVVGDSYFSEHADGIFIIVDLKIENLGDETRDVSPNYLKAIDSQGRTFEYSNDAWIHLDENMLFKQVQPGLPTTGQTIFDVPEGETIYLEVSDSLWGSNVKLIALGKA